MTASIPAGSSSLPAAQQTASSGRPGKRAGRITQAQVYDAAPGGGCVFLGDFLKELFLLPIVHNIPASNLQICFSGTRSEVLTTLNYLTLTRLVNPSKTTSAAAAQVSRFLEFFEHFLPPPSQNAQLGRDLHVPFSRRTLYFLTERLPRQLWLPIRILFFGPVLSTDHSILEVMSLSTARYQWTVHMPRSQFLGKTVRRLIPDDHFIPIEPHDTPKLVNIGRGMMDGEETEYDHTKLAQVTSFTKNAGMRGGLHTTKAKREWIDWDLTIELQSACSSGSYSLVVLVAPFHHGMANVAPILQQQGHCVIQVETSIEAKGLLRWANLWRE